MSTRIEYKTLDKNENNLFAAAYNTIILWAAATTTAMFDIQMRDIVETNLFSSAVQR